MSVIYEEPPTELEVMFIAGAAHRGIPKLKFHRMVAAFAQAGNISFDEGLRLICMGDSTWFDAKHPPR